MRILNRYNLDHIVNADQTPLFIEMPQERTLEHRGSPETSADNAETASAAAASVDVWPAEGIAEEDDDNCWWDELADGSDVEMWQAGDEEPEEDD
ncbi:hypothetical protein CLOP_g14927 [Closterium sp. NIES-67]|nr:hypothetical protein CLOP_g14927 [Closterium sp. NIES-67]